MKSMCSPPPPLPPPLFFFFSPVSSAYPFSSFITYVLTKKIQTHQLPHQSRILQGRRGDLPAQAVRRDEDQARFVGGSGSINYNKQLVMLYI